MCSTSIVRKQLNDISDKREIQANMNMLRTISLKLLDNEKNKYTHTEQTFDFHSPKFHSIYLNHFVIIMKNVGIVKIIIVVSIKIN